ncbi:DNA fragmentation factor subunit beta-like isoform X1 [Macrobrachium nipponense]|uniref:DNA fragmentation factor subunit beta-like isoform X1 n=1 Tax=Macrobrachium nipponense TaxID=159736 RepID=UPI0030C82BC1
MWHCAAMSRRNFVAVGPNSRKIGIVTSSYKRFVRKCRKKFDLQEEDIYFTLDDDTEVDEEYFEVLENGTNLYLKSREKKEKPSYSLYQLAEFLHKCLLNQPNLHEKVTEYLQKPEQSAVVLSLLARVAESSCSPSKKEDDLDWFKGLNTKFTTKESVMRNSAETRMRGYLEQVKKILLAGNIRTDSPCRNAVNFFKEHLSKSRYNADYFDRSAASEARLCDTNGLFECEGLYNEPACKDNHIINPYNTREARIVFSTWNLDHVIEKSRSILPHLRKALEGPRSDDVNLSYFHGLLFLHKCQQGKTETGNLKLVHIACHDKKPHVVRCDNSLVYKVNKNYVEDGNDTVDSSVSLSSHLQSGMITRQGLREKNRSRFNAVEDWSLGQKPLLGVTTRLGRKRVMKEFLEGKQKKARLVT